MSDLSVFQASNIYFNKKQILLHCILMRYIREGGGQYKITKIMLYKLCFLKYNYKS